MDAVIALPLAFASLAVTEANINGPGEESAPEFVASSSLDAYDINIRNNKITAIPTFSRIKEITRLIILNNYIYVLKLCDK